MNCNMLGSAMAAAMLALSASAAFAQNSSDPGSTIPTPGAERPSPATPAPPPPPPPPPPPSSDPGPRVSDPAVVTVPVPVPQPVTPPATIQLPADAPYPNGFADPAAPFGNDMSVQVREDDGFDWGLLGLLGLFGLFGLYRPRDRYRQTVHSERVDEGRPYDRR